MPAWVQALLLGIVQGLTEFFPVSSDGHLVLVPYLAGWQTPGLAFDVALHMGTLAALLVYFRREIVAIVLGVLGLGAADAALSRRLAVFLVLGSVPVAVAGLLLQDLIGGALRSPLVAVGGLLVTAVLLTLAERLRDRRVARSLQARPQRVAVGAAWTGDWVGDVPAPADRPDLGGLPIGADLQDPLGQTLAQIRLGQALIVGLLQPLALLPGVSRSGSTIVGGVASGLTREAATRFSFLLALPALVGAFILEAPTLTEPGPYSGSVIAVGIASAFAAGYVAIHFLVRLVARERLTLFARYCVFAAAVGGVGYLVIGPPSSV